MNYWMHFYCNTFLQDYVHSLVFTRSVPHLQLGSNDLAGLLFDFLSRPPRAVLPMSTSWKAYPSRSPTLLLRLERWLASSTLLSSSVF